MGLCLADDLSDIVDEIHERRGQSIPAPRRPKRLSWTPGHNCENAFTIVGINYSINDKYYTITARGFHVAQSVEGREAARVACQDHYDKFVDNLLEDA